MVFAGCEGPVANEEEEDVRAFVEDGTIAVVAGLCEPGARSDPVGQQAKNYVNVVVRKDNGIEFERDYLLLLGEIKPQELAASPNPFVNQTEVRLELGPGGKASPAAVDIYDLRRRKSSGNSHHQRSVIRNRPTLDNRSRTVSYQSPS